MKPLISIAIPVYNAQSFLDECINSVIGQTYDNLEILLIDDGSTDESSRICDNYCNDKRIRVFHRENMGLSSSRQFGFETASGEYVMTIDADDYISENCIEKLYKCISDSGCDIVACCRYDFLDGTKKIVKLNSLSGEVIQTSPDYLSKHLNELSTKVWLSDSWNKLYRSSFVKRTGVRFELPRKYNGNDYAFNYKLVLHCPSFCIINEPLLYHRLTPNSMVRKKNKPLQEGFEVVLSQIVKESETIGYDNMARPFSYIYSYMLCMVAFDISKEKVSICQTLKAVKKMFLADFKYREVNTFLTLYTIGNNFLTKTISFCISHNNQILLSLILWIYSCKISH